MHVIDRPVKYTQNHRINHASQKVPFGLSLYHVKARHMSELLVHQFLSTELAAIFPGKRCPCTVKFGWWIGNGGETAVAWKEEDGDDDSEDVDARASSC